MVQYGPDGSLDPSFGVGGVVSYSALATGARGVQVTANGRILVAGTYCGPEAEWCDAAAVAFLEDGSVDTGFGLNGIALMDADPADGSPNYEEGDGGSDLIIQPDGKIIVVGRGGPWWGADVFLARYHADGTVDLAFGDDGRVLTNVGGVDDSNTVAIAPDGRIYVTGYYTGGASPQDAYIACYLPNGNFDPSFGDDGALLLGLGVGNALAVQPDGKPVLALYTSAYWLVRYNADGTPDATLNSGGVIPAPSQAGNGDVALQDDGKILVCGLRGDSLVVVRYSADWSLGLQEFTNGSAPLIYPSPVTDHAIFEYALTNPGKLTCELIDGQGRSVRTLFNAERPTGQHREALDLSGIAAGQYMLVLHSEEGRTSVRVVKQ
ncbi:MAG: T9SS type A sorting domain-containing protein [Flavobacteriales bacterium]|nr:T9SS type A sorting domain-containing protein [Flavobacteriales bacterium]